VSTTRPFSIKGGHVLFALLAFFAAVIAVNVIFAIYAVRTFPGEDVRRSYLQGLHYNDTLSERRAQATLGWRATASLAPTNGGATLEVVLRDRDGNLLDGAVLSGDLRWPTTSHHDRSLSFSQNGAGRYQAELGALPDGRWLLRARAARGEGSLDFESELSWRASP
jgi:nitrogen fixation protein FixH